LSKRSLSKRFITLLGSVAVATLLMAEMSWGEEAPAGDDQIDEAPLAGTETEVTFVPNEIVVKTNAGGYQTRAVDAQSLAAVKQAATEVDAQEPWVEEAGPNYAYAPEFVPNDYHYDLQDWLRVIKAPSAWNDSRGVTGDTNAGIRIGVVDTGWQVNHPDLVHEDVGQWDFVAGDAVAHSARYHGTSVAGIAAADTNNTEGVASIGFDARFVMARACTNVCLTENTAPAIDWLAQTKGVKIINLSFGALYPGGTTDQLLEDAIQQAQAAGALVVASAGDTGDYTDNDPSTDAPAHYPSCFDGVLGIGSVNEIGTKADFSNTGSSCVDLVAPGVRVLTTFNEYDPTLNAARYAYVYGTSFSSPQVAGTAALIRARSPLLTNVQIANRLQNQATDVGDTGKDDLYGYGLLNARCSVNPANDGC